MSRLRVLLAVLVAAVSVAVPMPAGAVPILEATDAAELANKLAEATEEQDVCYGWVVEVRDESGHVTGVEQGSSLGPGVSPYAEACSPHVVFSAFLRYTSASSEASDSANYRIVSTLSGFEPPGLGALGISDGGLLGNNDDLVIANATALLPALVAEQGLAPPVPIEETTGTIPASDRPTNTPGSDRWRTHWPAFAFTGFLLLAGLAWIVTAVFVRRMQSRSPDFTLSSLLQED